MSDVGTASPLTIEASPLREFATQVLVAAGLAEEDAVAAAQGMISANLYGIDSHGVLRLIQYNESIERGEVNAHPEVRVVARHGATALIDADGGYGYRPSFMAIDLALELAHQFGVAFVGVRRSHHFGMAGLYTRRAAEAGAISYAWSNSSARIPPWGAIDPVLGNNPLSWAAPRRPPAPPIVLDIAISQVAFGKVRLARTEGRPIPAGWGLDRNGQPTTDAEEAFSSGLLSAIGGYKGVGLSLIGEVLAGCLTGSPFARDSDAHTHPEGGVGHVFAVVDVDAFGPRDAYEASVEALVAQVREARRPGGRTYLPGEIEQEHAKRHERHGIPISLSLRNQLAKLAARLGVPVDLLG